MTTICIFGYISCYFEIDGDIKINKNKIIQIFDLSQFWRYKEGKTHFWKAFRRSIFIKKHTLLILN